MYDGLRPLDGSRKRWAPGGDVPGTLTAKGEEWRVDVWCEPAEPAEPADRAEAGLLLLGDDEWLLDWREPSRVMGCEV